MSLSLQSFPKGRMSIGDEVPPKSTSGQAEKASFLVVEDPWKVAERWNPDRSYGVFKVWMCIG